MEENKLNRISANYKYIVECANVIYTKIRAIGSNFFLSDGSKSDQFYINVEDYRHGTVSIAQKKGVTRVCLDGTNYNILFKIYKNGFKFYNKELGIEYSYVDRKLNDEVHLKEIVKTINKTVEYFKFTTIGEDYTCVLKYAIKDPEGKSSVECYQVNDKNEKELIDYTIKKKNEQDEKEEDIPYAEDDDLDFLESPEFKAKLEKKKSEAIKAQINNFEECNYDVIKFSLPQKFRYNISNYPYSCILPDNVMYYVRVNT